MTISRLWQTLLSDAPGGGYDGRFPEMPWKVAATSVCRFSRRDVAKKHAGAKEGISSPAGCQEELRVSNTIDFDLKERVRTAVDIVDVVRSQLELRPQGQQLVALCPWHRDRHPSLTINPARQTWRCWVCNIGGDVFSFVMKRDGVSFPEALRMLAEQAGIALPRFRGEREAEPGSPGDKATLLTAVRWAADQYHDFFLSSEQAAGARKYAASRGLSDESIARFKIGYAPDNWDWLLSRGTRAGFSAEVLHACGLTSPRKSGSGFFDMFRHRLMFPIWDLQGRPISLGGRVLPGSESFGGKYINGPETKLFSKSRQLYGLHIARDAILRSRQALVMEGYTDVIASFQGGIENAVAVLGTALGEDHLRLLKRFAETIVLVLDGDQAGQRRAEEVLELFIRQQLDLRVLTLPDDLDPADFLSQRGREAFLAAVDQAPDAFEYQLQRYTAGIDLTYDTHRANKAVERILESMAQAPVPITDLKLQQSLTRLGRTFSLPVEILQQRLMEYRQRRRPGSKNLPSRVDSTSSGPESGDLRERVDEAPAADVRPARISPHEPISGLDRELFETLVEAPEYVSLALESIDQSWLATTSARCLLQAYQSLELSGLAMDVENILLALEDEFLKGQIVYFDHRASGKRDVATLSTADRFASILQRYRDIQHRAASQQQIAQMQSKRFQEDEEVDVLDELFASQRVRQGFVDFQNPQGDIEGSR